MEVIGDTKNPRAHWELRGFRIRVLRTSIFGGSGVSSSLSMKMEIFFAGYPPCCPLGRLDWFLWPINSADAG
jgi:hypothetical protein